MQTPKTSSTKSSSGSEGVRRISPRSVTSHPTQRSCVRQLKTTGLEPSSSVGQPIRTSKITSPRLIDRSSSRGPVPEKKRLGRVVELENQVTQLQNALTTVKDQLIVSEAWKKQAKLDAEESRKELLAMSLKLEESQKLLAWSSSEQIDQKATFPQEFQDEHALNSADSGAPSAALLEIDQLKVNLDTLTESEATQTKRSELADAEIQFLKDYRAETLSLMEEMKSQLEDCKSSESQAQALASETLSQLETAKKTMESLKFRSDEYKYKAILLELEQSRARVRSLEGIISKMKTDQKTESEESTALKSELGKMKSSDIRFHEDQCRLTLDVTAELNKSKAEIEELKANLMDKETELQCILEENEDLNAKLANLILGKQEKESKQDELCEKRDENEKLKLEIKKMKGAMEASKQEFNGLMLKLTILEKESYENEKLKLEMKRMEGVKEAMKKSNERLEETEEELRRLKVQMGQWRKAAEAATAMLCEEKSDNNGRMVVERTLSMGHYSPRRRMNIGSPGSVDIYDEDDDDELLKRKHGNMLKRIGVLWKKPQNK